MDATVSPLILNGQSPYMILQNHPEISQCEKTIYNYIDQGALSVCNLDLPKQVKYKPRKAHRSEIDDTGIFDDINRAIGTELFCKTMPLIITDRGGEFKHPEALECGIDNVLRQLPLLTG